MSEAPNKVFTWGSVEFFVTRHEGEHSNSIIARLTFHSTKGTTRNQAGIKRLPLRLLPPCNAAYDSLFWMVNLGLIDQVFVGVTTWADINRIPAHKDGTPLHIKASMRDTPIFRTVAIGNQSRAVSPKLMTYPKMRDMLEKLSKHCELGHSVQSSLLRRLAACQLSKLVSEEERCSRLGHNDADNVYWAHYRNTTSTIDFQGMRHSMPLKDVSVISSVFFGRGGASPPTSLSKEGIAQVYTNVDIRDMQNAMVTLKDDLVGSYGSLKQAFFANDDLKTKWEKHRIAYNSKVNNMKAAVLRAEIRKYWLD
ncbi:hypothetical protein SPBR_04321 [Sporothrix brasiliensis 5110]|uniref:Uncharacterized protein n=1 Tax=Sporothrix brasiliensis 5110 TaxID=1398154 RepID=A0A0C2IW83_9PEZI|nr:uncharacterized protein SPBR_04321 [Sporothrix brasiliensis 5110]KIH93421.1 hypothetical protein SPBR_04321 [Sporothrix brasiliensis 5110]